MVLPPDWNVEKHKNWEEGDFELNLSKVNFHVSIELLDCGNQEDAKETLKNKVHQQLLHYAPTYEWLIGSDVNDPLLKHTISGVKLGSVHHTHIFFGRCPVIYLACDFGTAEPLFEDLYQMMKSMQYREAAHDQNNTTSDLNEIGQSLSFCTIIKN